MRGLPGAITLRQITPRGSTEKNPQNPVHDRSMVPPGAAPTLPREQVPDHFPMLIFELIPAHPAPPMSSILQKWPYETQPNLLRHDRPTLLHFFSSIDYIFTYILIILNNLR